MAPATSPSAETPAPAHVRVRALPCQPHARPNGASYLVLRALACLEEHETCVGPVHLIRVVHERPREAEVSIPHREQRPPDHRRPVRQQLKCEVVGDRGRCGHRGTHLCTAVSREQPHEVSGAMIRLRYCGANLGIRVGHEPVESGAIVCGERQPLPPLTTRVRADRVPHLEGQRVAKLSDRRGQMLVTRRKGGQPDGIASARVLRRAPPNMPIAVRQATEQDLVRGCRILGQRLICGDAHGENLAARPRPRKTGKVLTAELQRLNRNYTLNLNSTTFRSRATSQQRSGP